MRDDKLRMAKADLHIARSAFDSPAGLDERLNRISGAISDQALYLESELNVADTQDAIRAVERRAEALSLLLQHVQSAAWEKARLLV